MKTRINHADRVGSEGREREQENEKETEKEHRQIIKGSNPVADWQLQSQRATGRRNTKITMLANTMHLGATPQ